MLKSLSMNNVLHEAAELLKTQSKHVDVNNGFKHASFEDMLEKKSGFNETDISEADINGETKDNLKNEINAGQNADSSVRNNVNKTNELKVVQKENLNDVNKNNASEKKISREIIPENDKILNRDKRLKKTEDHELNNPAEMFNFLPASKIKLSSLSLNDKEKIQDIVRKLSNGDISRNAANTLIANIINRVKPHKLNNDNNGGAAKAGFKDNSLNFKLGNNTGLVNEKKSDDKPNPVSDGIKDAKNSLKDIIKNNAGKSKSAEVKEKENPDNAPVKIKFDIILNNSQIRNDSMIRSGNPEPQKILEQNKEALFNNIAKNTKIVMSQGHTEFSTMIRPENFGRIDFKFSIKDGRVSGRMIFQSQESADFFKANVQEIKAVFEKANVELENLDMILAGSRFADTADSQHQERNFANESGNTAIKGLRINGINSFEENIISNSVQNYSRPDNGKVNLFI